MYADANYAVNTRSAVWVINEGKSIATRKENLCATKMEGGVMKKNLNLSLTKCKCFQVQQYTGFSMNHPLNTNGSVV